MRVLLADDSVEIRSALHLLLNELGHSVIEAQDAAGLLALLELGPVDMLLLDWELPGFMPEDHLPLVRRRRPECVVVAMSGNPEAEAESGRLGAEAFVSKNDPPDRLLGILGQ